jgi:hypothetical protein
MASDAILDRFKNRFQHILPIPKIDLLLFVEEPYVEPEEASEEEAPGSEVDPEEEN